MTGNLSVSGNVTATGYDNNSALPTIRPSLLLDFANSKTLDPRITFTRGSTATYWDGHTTVKAEENLIKYSTGLIGTGWIAVSGFAAVANQGIAPDGTNTASQFTPAAGDVYFQGSVNVGAGSTYTLSVYVKQAASGSATNFRMAINNTSAWGTGQGAVVALTSSWQRLTLTGSLSSGATANVHMDGTYASNGSLDNSCIGNVLIWGAQLEIRGAATAYTPTTSSPVVKYQPVLQTATPNGARFDHDPVTGESKGLLIEEARTNLMTYSNVLTGWYYSNVTRECETVIAPDGTATAVASRGDTIGSYQIYKPVSGISAGAVRTYSLYVKKYGSRYCYLANDPLNSAFVWFDLDNDAAVTEQGSNVISAGSEAVGNGWYRIWMVNSQHNNYTQYGFATQDSSSTAWGTANAPVTYSGIAWGYQFEVGSFPTSYIPTSGSTVTRSADAAELPSNTWYSDSGTLYADFNIAGPATGSYGNVVQLLENVGSRWGFPYINGNNTLTALAYNAPDITNPTLGGLSYGSNTRVVMTSPNGSQFVTSLNGASVVTTSATAVSNPISLSIGKVLSDNNTFTGTFSKIAYYPQRLPNATLQAMTEE